MRLYFRKMMGPRVRDALRGSIIKPKKPGSSLQQPFNLEMLET